MAFLYVTPQLCFEIGLVGDMGVSGTCRSGRLIGRWLGGSGELVLPSGLCSVCLQPARQQSASLSPHLQPPPSLPPPVHLPAMLAPHAGRRAPQHHRLASVL